MLKARWAPAHRIMSPKESFIKMILKFIFTLTLGSKSYLNRNDRICYDDDNKLKILGVNRCVSANTIAMVLGNFQVPTELVRLFQHIPEEDGNLVRLQELAPLNFDS